MLHTFIIPFKYKTLLSKKKRRNNNTDFKKENKMNWKIHIVLICALVGMHVTESLNASENIDNCDTFIKDLNIEKQILQHYSKHDVLTEEYNSRNINNYHCLQYLIKLVDMLEDDQEENMESSEESSLLKTRVPDRLKRKHKARPRVKSNPNEIFF